MDDGKTIFPNISTNFRFWCLRAAIFVKRRLKRIKLSFLPFLRIVLKKGVRILLLLYGPLSYCLCSSNLCYIATRGQESTFNFLTKDLKIKREDSFAATTRTYNMCKFKNNRLKRTLNIAFLVRVIDSKLMRRKIDFKISRGFLKP